MTSPSPHTTSPPPCENGRYAADALRVNSTIKLLDLDGNNIGPEGAVALNQGLIENNTLESLWLGNNDLGDVGAAAIAEASARVGSKLRLLDLEFNEVGPDGARSIAKALRGNGSLNTLWLGGNPDLGDEGAEALAEAVGDFSALTELSLQHGGLTAEGARALGNALRDESSRLEVLWLGGNPNLGDDGAASLADALCVNSTLLVLALDGCGLTDEGGATLYSSLEENETITMLDLDGNGVGDMGVLSLIVHATKSNRSGATDNGKLKEAWQLYKKKKNEHKQELRL